MYPLSDKDLDRISREAAEQFAVEPHASDWDQLASRLEKEMPVQKDDKKRRALWLLLILLLTCGGGLLWLLTGNGDATNGVATTTPSSQESIAKNNSTSETTKNTDPTTSGTSKENSVAVNPGEPVSSNSTSTEAATTETKATTSKETIASEPVKTEKEHVIAQSASAGKESLSTTKKMATKKALVSVKSKTAFLATTSPNKNSVRIKTKNKSKELLNSNTETNSSTAATANSSNVSNSAVGNSQTANPPASSSTDVIPATTLTPATTIDKTNSQQPKTTDSVATNTVATANKKAPAKKGKPSEKGLSFGLTAGFDYSRINNVGDNKPGYDLGLQVSYALNKRWSFNTGFILTKKNYTAKGEDFHPPKHYWTTYIALNDVEGDCQMWDIPLNIRYNLTTSKTKWFISSGFSTYIMRKQNYNYYYTVNSTPREKVWSMNSQTNYWFNVLNISAGVEKPLSRNWSIVAEPFIKAPLKGVGFGNMNVNSYGVLATLKFHPEFKR